MLETPFCSILVSEGKEMNCMPGHSDPQASLMLNNSEPQGDPLLSHCKIPRTKGEQWNSGSPGLNFLENQCENHGKFVPVIQASMSTTSGVAQQPGIKARASALGTPPRVG